jgi:hypothetical protein
LVTLAQQVARRVVGEAFRGAATDVDQAVERVVVVAAIAFAAVVDAGEVAVGVVGVSEKGTDLFSFAENKSVPFIVALLFCWPVFGELKWIVTTPWSCEQLWVDLVVFQKAIYFFF